jgi:hypothetical protein
MLRPIVTLSKIKMVIECLYYIASEAGDAYSRLEVVQLVQSAQVD